MTWQRPPAILEIRSDEVHVWRVDCDRPASHVQQLRQYLSPDEAARSERFLFAEHRDQFAVGRGALRTVLGRYLGVAPARLRFRYGPHGKPYLADDHATTHLQFNVTHSQRRALIAVSLGRLIGVDLEYVGREVDIEAIAGRFFSQREVAALRTLPPDQRVNAFFACWTRKEAYVKAKGVGLSFPLSELDVSVAADAPTALLQTAWDAGEAERWSLRDLPVGPGYRAAIAVQGHGWRLQCWEWPS